MEKFRVHCYRREGANAMGVALMESPVAKKKATAKVEPKKSGTMIRVSDELADALRKVCALEGMSFAEFSEAHYLPVIQARYRELIASESSRIEKDRR